MPAHTFFIASNAADVTRVAQYAQPGDFILDSSLNQLYVHKSNGPNVVATGVAAVRVAPLTDSTGGTGAVGGTLAAIAAGASYAQADMTAVKNAISTLWAEMAAMRTAFINAGLMTGP